MSGFLYKPIGQGQIGGGRGNFLIENTNYVSGGWYDKDGKLVERFDRFQGTPEPGQSPGVKFTTKQPGGAYGEDLEARFTDNKGVVHTYKIPKGGQRYEGSDEDPNSLHPVNKGPQGGGSGGTSGVPSQFQPGQVGQYGATPAYIGQLFPDAVTTKYNPITAAPYNFTDPFQFAEKYGDFSRKEVSKNFSQAQDMALQSLDTELKGLKEFTPAASALKRQEISVDNQFNQQQRSQQVDQALPGVNADLNAQADRARTYASGAIPDSVADKGLEIGLRSQAADRASVGGFGSSSSVSRKASDLLSADARVKLSQYGDQLLTGNINQKAALNLAPTEYSNAGGQINVNPSESTSQLTSSYTGALNQMAGLSTSQAFSSEVQQNQYTTGLEQQTRTFNASNTLQNDQFNANNQNNFALSKFGYQAGYANSVAGASQTDINTNFGLQQQQMYNDLMQQYMQMAQNSGLTSGLGSLTGILGSIVPGLGSLGGSGKSTGGGGGLAGAGSVGEVVTGGLAGAGSVGEVVTGGSSKASGGGFLSHLGFG